MELMNYKKIITIIMTFLVILTISTNSFAVKIYTSKLAKNDKLEFTANSWKVYKTQAIAESINKGKHPKAIRYLKNGETFQIMEINGNVLKIKNDEFIYYDSTASRYFKKIEETNEQKEKAQNSEKKVVKVTKVKINTQSTNLTKGKTIQLTAQVTPSNATNKDVTWKSSDKTIATVDKNGMVTAKKAGKVTITATAKDGSGKRATTTLTIKNNIVKVTQIELNSQKQNLTKGQTTQLTAQVTPNNATNKNVTWKSSNKTIATVDNNGIVTAKKVGKVTITATAKDGSGKKATITIRVEEKESVYDVILFWGQSNMVGTCSARKEDRYNPSNSNSVKAYSKLSGIDEDLLRKNEKNRNSIKIYQTDATVFEYMYAKNKLEEISSSRPVLGENLAFSIKNNSLVPANASNRALAESSGVNMIPEFCREYYKKTGHKVVIVFAALGGRTIRQFLPYDDAENTSADKQRMLYEAVKEKYTKAIDYLEKNNFKIGNKLYVVCQGESNVGTTKESYKHLYLKVHNNLKKDLKIQKGVIVETAREAGTFTMNGTNGVLSFNGVRYKPDDVLGINGVHYAQEELIKENKDIILGSSFAYDHYVPLEFDYNNCNTKITLDSNGNKLPYSEALKKARSIEDYMDDKNLNNGIHYTSAALSQIGRESARNLAKVINH